MSGNNITAVGASSSSLFVAKQPFVSSVLMITNNVGSVRANVSAAVLALEPKAEQQRSSIKALHNNFTVVAAKYAAFVAWECGTANDTSFRMAENNYSSEVYGEAFSDAYCVHFARGNASHCRFEFVENSFNASDSRAYSSSAVAWHSMVLIDVAVMLDSNVVSSAGTIVQAVWLNECTLRFVEWSWYRGSMSSNGSSSSACIFVVSTVVRDSFHCRARNKHAI